METLTENIGFLGSVYDGKSLMGVLLIFVFVDLCLKGWGMWRSARMSKKWWFIALLLINSMGILPAIFLLSTNNEYKKLGNK